MGNLRRSSAAVWLVILGVILLFTVAACSSGDGSGQDNATPEPTIEALLRDGSVMRLTANGCTADCAFASDEEFTLAVEIAVAPPGGYTGAQSMIDFGNDLTYNAAAAGDEIVWPDCDPAIALSSPIGSTLVNHGCLTGLVPPLPVSTYTGIFAELSLTCSSESSKTDVRLVPNGDPVAPTSGAGFVYPDLVTQSLPEVSDLTITCGG